MIVELLLMAAKLGPADIAGVMLLQQQLARQSRLTWRV